ncbi:MAG: hypothetical protein ACJZ46_01045 [Candidatus Thalassarchaeaceae archaeon]
MMVGAATFHAAIVEITIGSLTLAVICNILCLQFAFSLPYDRLKLSKNMLITMDRAGLMGALLGSIMMPFAIFTGTLSVSGNPVGSELLYNKFLYSGLAFGFWASYLIGRIRMGSEIWKSKKTNLLQVITSILAFTMTITVASIGGKIVRNESILDLMPFWFPLNTTIIMSPLISTLLLIIGVSSIFIMYKLDDLIDSKN